MPPPMSQKPPPQSRPFLSDDRKFSSLSSIGGNCITPDILNEAYNIDSNVGDPRATQAVLESLDQSFSSDDLMLFQQQFSLPNYPVSSSIGGHAAPSQYCSDNLDMCVEGSMDVQYLTAVSESPTSYIYTDAAFFSLWLMDITDMTTPPLVISISYGVDEIYVTQSEFDAFNTQAIKLSAMGVTLVSSAGDDGSVSWLVRYDAANCGYMPYFPATSPYVTAVGGTQVNQSYCTFLFFRNNCLSPLPLPPS